MKKFPELTNIQWNCYCECMCDPIPLSKADLRTPFVYERQYGVFYVASGKHPTAMSFLLALQHGCEDGIDVAEKLNIEYSSGTADYWLEHTPGAAFLSSVSSQINVATGIGLTVQERRLFGNYNCLFEG